MTSYLDDILAAASECQKFGYFRDIKQTGDNVMMTCPFHGGGKEKHPSFGVEIHTLQYHCFACGERGKFDELVWLLGRVRLSGCFWDDREKVSLSLHRENTPNVPEIVHPTYNIGLTKYMADRGVTHKICEMYKVGYINDIVVFPIRNIRGENVFYVTRNVYEKRYQLSPIRKPLYGLYEVMNYFADAKAVFVTEGPFNVLSLAVWGYAGLGLLGTGSDYQIDILRRLPFRVIILALDGDKFGRKGAYRIKNVLRDKIVKFVGLPDGTDINDLSKEQFDNVLCMNGLGGLVV